MAVVTQRTGERLQSNKNMNTNIIGGLTFISSCEAIITGQFAYPLGLRAKNVVPLEHVAPKIGAKRRRLSRMSHVMWQSLQFNGSGCRGRFHFEKKINFSRVIISIRIYCFQFGRRRWVVHRTEPMSREATGRRSTRNASVDSSTKVFWHHFGLI